MRRIGREARIATEVPKPADSPRAVPELSGLRIPRGTEGPRRPTGWLILGSVLAVALALGAYFAASSYLGAIPVEKTTASLVTQGQVLTLLTVSGYVEAETRADLSPRSPPGSPSCGSRKGPG